jgi:hypothetical protein
LRSEIEISGLRSIFKCIPKSMCFFFISISIPKSVSISTAFFTVIFLSSSQCVLVRFFVRLFFYSQIQNSSNGNSRDAFSTCKMYAQKIIDHIASTHPKLQQSKSISKQIFVTFTSSPQAKMFRFFVVCSIVVSEDILPFFCINNAY